MKRMLGLLIALVAILTSWVEAQHMPTVEFIPSQATDILVDRFDSVRHADLEKAFPPELRTLEPYSLVLTNRTNRRIIGIAVQWTVTDAEGHERRIRYRSDSYMSSLSVSNPVALPQERIVLSPGAAVPESLIGRPSVGPGVGHRTPYAKLISDASSVTIELDSVILEDGEVVGPNNLDFDSEIEARRTAATQVAKLVRAGLANGKSPSSVLAPVIAASPSRTDYLHIWMAQYAREVLQAKNTEKALIRLDEMPMPPSFFHRKNKATE